MKKYTPNFNDPRVQRKARSALQWATCMLREEKSSNWSRTHIDKRIGFAHNSLGAWLRSNLLNNTTPYYNPEKGIAKGYTLNAEGAAKIARLLGIEFNPRRATKSIALQTSITEYSSVFETGVFEYTDKGNRFYNELQNIRTEIRKPLFSHYGYKFNYDIVNAYPTVILQYAKNTARYRKPFRELESYVDNSRQYRQCLADEIGCEYDTAKQIIVAKFNGATLRPDAAIARLLTRTQLYRLKHNTRYSLLNQDIQRLWKGIARSESRTSISPRQRMQKYQAIEREIQNCIRRQFERNNIQIFLEHDGWRSNDWIDPYLLQLVIFKRTGYRVSINCEIDV